MKGIKKTALLLIALVFSTNIFAQYDMKAPLPVDPNIRMGKLKNGMSYYIRHNEEPKNRAEFYIVQNVGAILENDDQNGLAHFLEHMCFNGTKHFPGNGIIKTLERYGIEFGRNVNAYTAQDETVYNLSDIPTTNSALIDTCLLVLNDWSHFLTLDEKEIDDERGVISEEWRTRRNARMRIMLQTSPVIFEGSKYAVRDVIGDLNIIKNFKYQTLRDYYHKWYRPDLQAIVVVGDIDVNDMENRIKTLFSQIPAVKNAAERPVFGIPDRKDIGYVCATDKEVTQSSVALYSIMKDENKHDHQSVKDGLITGYFNGMLGARIGEMLQKGNPNLISGGVQKGEFTRGHSVFYVSATARPNLEREAFSDIYTEFERARRHGFTQPEFERVRKEMLSNLEMSYKQKDKISNEDIVGELQNMFLNGSVSLDIEYYYPMIKWMLDHVTLDDVNKFAANVFTKKNMVLAVTGPSEGVKHATKEELLAAMDQVEKSNIEPYNDNIGDAELLDVTKLKGGKIVSTKKLPVCNAEMWTLSNGAKVIYAKASYNKDNIALTGVSMGGSSLYDVKDLAAASLLSQFVPAFGLGDYSAVDLQKIMAGKTAGSSVKLSGIQESVGGSSNNEDLETMMQMVYMRFAHPRFDDEVFNVLKDRSMVGLKAQMGQPNQMMQDSLDKITTNYHPRSFTMTPEVFGSITIDQIKKIYLDRFKDASDFVFYLVGDVDADKVKPLVEKYLGSIESINRKETYRDNKVRMPKGRTVRDIVIPFETSKATVIVELQRDMPYTLKGAYELSVLKAILDLRYTTNIREKEGGTYGVGVNSSFSRRPYAAATVIMQFDCDPAKAEHLKSLIYKELDEIKAKGVTADELANVIKNMKKNHEQSLKENGYVMSAVMNFNEWGVDITDPKNFDGILDAMKPADIQKFAKTMFDKNTNNVDIIFHTEK